MTTQWHIRTFDLNRFVLLHGFFDYIMKMGGTIEKHADRPVYTIYADRKRLAPMYLSALDRMANTHRSNRI